MAKGWRKVGEGLAKSWRRVGKGSADFLAPSNFGIPEAPVQRHGFVTPWTTVLWPKKYGTVEKHDDRVSETPCFLGEKLGVEIWEGDEHRKFQFVKSGDSLNGGNLFSELPFL